jgi:hypothetical protein
MKITTFKLTAHKKSFECWEIVINRKSPDMNIQTERIVEIVLRK